MVHNRGNVVSGLADVGGGDGLTGGDRDEVLDIGTGDLGDDVAVLNLNGDNLDNGVVHAVLGGDITASVLHGGSDGVSDSGSDDGGNGVVSVGTGDGGNGTVSVSTGVSVSGVSSSVESISIGFSLSIGLTSVDMVGNGGVTQVVGGLLAKRHVLDLFGVDGDGVADVLGGGDTVLGDQDVVLCDAVGSGSGVVSSHRGVVGKTISKTMEGLGVSVRAGGGAGKGQKA
jgi:hypothetical protein